MPARATANHPRETESMDQGDEAVARAARVRARRHEKKGSGRRVWFRRLVGVLALGALIGLLVIAWMPKPIGVDVAEVEVGALRVTVDEDGRTRVKDRYLVSAPLLANLARIELRPGDVVEEGRILARLVPLTPPLLDERTQAQSMARVRAARASERQAHAAINRAQAALTFAERETGRKRTLHQSGALPVLGLQRAELEERTRREELASAHFAARVADYELQMAQAALGSIRTRGKQKASDVQPEEQMQVVAPVSGRVLKVIQASEGVVQPGTPLLEVGDPKALEIVVDVLTTDAVHTQPGARVSIERWGGGHALKAHVRLVEPSAFSRVSALGVEEQRVNVVIDLDEPPERWSALGDGYRVEARIIVWEEQNVRKVPASALIRHGKEWAVFVLEGELIALRPVKLGRRNGLEAQVIAGVEEGERVVLHPSDRVADGVKALAR